MDNIPPLTRIMDRGAESGGEFERLMNQLLLCFADRHRFEYEPVGRAGVDGGIDGLARRGGVPSFEGPVAFQFKWLWDNIHKGSKARQIADALARAGQSSDEIRHWVLVTPHDLTAAETEWLQNKLERRAGLAVHHWGQSRIEALFRNDCPALLARYYPHEARQSLTGYDGHDFRAFAADYRKKVAIAYRRLRTIGIPPETLKEQDGGSEIPLDRIFVPQRFTPEEAPVRFTTLAGLLESRECCVLLGDPGMGKTTVLSFVSLLYSDNVANLPEFHPPTGVIPFLVPIRDFLRLKQERPDVDFVEYLACRARTDLNLPYAHRAFFEATLRMGEALVLVDGLDEAGTDSNRHRIAVMIQTLQAQFPNCPYWVTSRIYGYTHDVRLPKEVFSHYRVGRLEPEQIDEFIARWYAVQYPENARERDKHVQSLQGAVRTPSVQRLAGNPLLLTLMAFIHRGGRLPQDRGELYEQCIQMLLRTWPDAKRQADPAHGDAISSHPFEKLGLHIATQKDYLAHLAMHVQEQNQASGDDEGRALIRRGDALDCLAERHLQKSRRGRPAIDLAVGREEMEHFLDYVRDRTGLLIDKGAGQISFIHLSFQEYLAAWLPCCLEPPQTEHDQRSLFDSHLGQPAWEEVLLLRLYVMLSVNGGGGAPMFDAVVGGLLDRLNRANEPAGWFTLARAVRDNLEFRPAHKTIILQRILDFWFETPPRFDNEWFNLLEELCRFSEPGRNELNALLDVVWRGPDPSRAVACLHLCERLGLSKGEARISQRPDVVERMDELLVAHASNMDWRQTLCFFFDCLLGNRGADATIKYLRGVIRGLVPPAGRSGPAGEEDSIWKQAIVIGSCLRILAGRAAAIPDDLNRFFQDCVFRAIEQEINVTDRHALAAMLGHLGDPRVAVDLRLTGHPDDHPGYVQVPEGKYLVGDQKRPVTFAAPFWLSKYPVTNSQFALFIEDGGYRKPDLWSADGWKFVDEAHLTEPRFSRNPKFNAPNQPVVGVSWWEAEAFCRWAGGCLPTVDQSEAAARGPDGLEYPWGHQWTDGICNSHEANLGGTSAVGIFPRDRSPVGDAMDIAGNVLEWCDNGAPGPERVFRGGCWGYDAGHCRAAYCYGIEPTFANDSLSFRVAAVPPG